MMVTVGAHTVGHSIDSISAFTDAEGADHLNMHVSTWLIESSVNGFFRGELLSLEMVDPTGTALTSTSLSQDFSAFETGTLSFLGQSAIDDGRTDVDSLVFFPGTWRHSHGFRSPRR